MKRKSKGKPKPKLETRASAPVTMSTVLKTEHSVDVLTEIVGRLTQERDQITSTVQAMSGDIARLELLRDLVRRETELRDESVKHQAPYLV
jgi:hypothetical protein